MILQTTIPLIVACAVVLMTSLSSGADVFRADVRFYVDGPAFQKYQATGVESQEDLEQAIQGLVDDMNTKYYSSLAKNGVDLQLRLEKVVYQDVIVPGQNGKIHVDTIWKGFEKYLVDNNQYSDSFDLTMLLTGLDMWSPESDNYGMAYLSTVCMAAYRSGTSEITGGLDFDGLAVAHELGHIFGAGHDESSCQGDQYTAGNVMNTVNYFDDPDRFEFSYCSAMQFWKKFYSLENQCLMESTNPSTEAPTTKAPTTKAQTTEAPKTQAPTTKSPPTKAPTTKAPVTPNTSSKQTPDQACQKLGGVDFRLYRPYYNLAGYGDVFCKKLRCISNKYTNRYHMSEHSTPDGIPCALNKVCSSGKCVASVPTPFEENCPWGDHDITVWNFRACSANSCGTKKWQNNYCCTFCPRIFPSSAH